jgi:hypothetical protein
LNTDEMPCLFATTYSLPFSATPQLAKRNQTALRVLQRIPNASW